MPIARGPHHPLSRPLRRPLPPPRSRRAAASCRDLLIPSPGPAAGEPRRLRRAAKALREQVEAGAQVAEGPDPSAPRSSLNPPLFPWQQTEVS